MLAAVLVGGFFSFLLFKSGLPNLVPVLLWVPVLSFLDDGGILLGMIGGSLFFLVNQDQSPGPFSFLDLVMGFAAGFGGLFVFSFFPFSGVLDAVIFPLLVLSFLWLVYSTRHSLLAFLGGSALCLLIGWFALHVWVIPLALPALLGGFFLSANAEFSIYRPTRLWDRARDSIIGVFSGVLPGLGPGLVGLFWFSSRASPSLLIANLVFTTGFVSLSGRIRSFAAAALNYQSLPDWPYVLAWLFFSVLVSFTLNQFFSKPLAILPLEGWVLLHAFSFVWLGGHSTLLLFCLSFCSRSLLVHHQLPLSLGLLTLFLPILWFYGG